MQCLTISTSLKESLYLLQRLIYFPFIKYNHISGEKVCHQIESLMWLKVDSEVSLPHGPDHRFWWNTSGYALAILLRNAGYSADGQYRALSFFTRIIASNMGVARDGRTLSWQSFMTDDGIPIELSWDWGSGNESPKIRYSIEPLGLEAGTAADRGNQHAEADFRQQLLSSLPRTRLEWFNHFKEYFNYINLDNDDLALEGHCSQIFYAFDLNETDIKSKAYFFPVFKARAEGQSKWTTILQAIESAPHCTMNRLRALSIFHEYASERYNEALELEMFAIDLIDPLASRLKIYFRSRETSFTSVIDSMTLGGRIGGKEVDRGIADLNRLWNAVFEVRDLSNEPLPYVNHRTAGILYYVEFRLDDFLPSVKIYIPVRHYSASDETIIQGLDSYLRYHSRNKYMPMYTKTMSSLFTDKITKSSTGLQTYIGCSICGDGALRIVSYLNARPLDIISQRQFDIGSVNN